MLKYAWFIMDILSALKITFFNGANFCGTQNFSQSHLFMLWDHQRLTNRAENGKDWIVEPLYTRYCAKCFMSVTLQLLDVWEHHHICLFERGSMCWVVFFSMPCFSNLVLTTFSIFLELKYYFPTELFTPFGYKNKLFSKALLIEANNYILNFF